MNSGDLKTLGALPPFPVATNPADSACATERLGDGGEEAQPEHCDVDECAFEEEK